MTTFGRVTEVCCPILQLLQQFYGRRGISLLAERTVVGLFERTGLSVLANEERSHPASASVLTTTSPPSIAEFVAYVLYRTALPNIIIFHAFHLLGRLSREFEPDPLLSSSPLFYHGLVFTSLVLATKYLMDDAYDNNSWSIASMGLFTLRDVNAMERSVFAALDMRLRVGGEDLGAILRKKEKTFMFASGDVDEESVSRARTRPRIRARTVGHAGRIHGVTRRHTH